MTEFVSEYSLMPEVHGAATRYFFPNGWGASIIRHDRSYGGRNGNFEIAVLKGDIRNWDIHYENPVANGDVIGHLDFFEVANALSLISKFPQAT